MPFAHLTTHTCLVNLKYAVNMRNTHFILQPRARDVETAASTQRLLMTGSVPGIAASKWETLELTRVPNCDPAPNQWIHEEISLWLMIEVVGGIVMVAQPS